jgi:hypothetical protein
VYAPLGAVTRTEKVAFAPAAQLPLAGIVVHVAPPSHVYCTEE